MDWARAIERNSEALKGIIAALFAMLGLDGNATVSQIPRSVHRAVRRILRPAESAVRRLIVIAARGLVVKLPAARPVSRPMPVGKIGKGGGSSRPPSFQLFDTRKNFAPRRRRKKAPRVEPRIHFYPYDTLRPAPLPADPAPPPDGLVNAEPLTRRLQILKLALEDLPRQARRLARWRARRETMPSPKFRSPLRLGRPPGSRRKPVHLVDEVLIECHGLAWDALKSDTS